MPLIAPYWADADTRGIGEVWYRETTSQADRDRAQREIRANFREAARFVPQLVFIATWDNIGYYPRRVNKVLLLFYLLILILIVVFAFSDKHFSMHHNSR